MCYDTKTLKPLHRLTEIGKVEYERMLEEKADEILFKHFHPIKWFFLQIKYFYKELKSKYGK